MFIFLMPCQRKLTNLIYTVLEPFVLTEESCSVIVFSLSAFKSKSCYEGLIYRSERSIWWYIIYITKGIYFCFYCGRSWYLYILQDVCFYFTRKKFYCCYSYNSVKVLESPGIWIWKYAFCLSQKIVISCDVSCNLFSYQEYPSWMLLLSLLRGYVFNKGLFN